MDLKHLYNMEPLNAYPPGTINLRPLRNQTPESWKLKAAIAKRIWDHYKIPCWVYSKPQTIKINGKQYLSIRLSLSKDNDGKEYMACNDAGYCPRVKENLILTLENYPPLRILL